MKKYEWNCRVYCSHQGDPRGFCRAGRRFSLYQDRTRPWLSLGRPMIRQLRLCIASESLQVSGADTDWLVTENRAQVMQVGVLPVFAPLGVEGCVHLAVVFEQLRVADPAL